MMRFGAIIKIEFFPCQKLAAEYKFRRERRGIYAERQERLSKQTK